MLTIATKSDGRKADEYAGVIFESRATKVHVVVLCVSYYEDFIKNKCCYATDLLECLIQLDQ